MRISGSETVSKGDLPGNITMPEKHKEHGYEEE
jgi:hypothetical protein